jgi:hypothetical protein
LALLNQAAVGGEAGGNIRTLFGGSTSNNPQTAFTVRCCGFCELVRNHLSVCSMLVNVLPHLALAYARTADCQMESFGFPIEAMQTTCGRRETRYGFRCI